MKPIPSAVFCLVAWLATAATGCSEHHSHEADARHVEPLTFVAYDTAYELYAEAEPLVAGEASELLVHITLIDTFRPLESGGLTARLGSGSESTADRPERPGIFRLTLTPEAAGPATLTFDLRTEHGTTRLTVPDVPVGADRHEAENTAAVAAATVQDAIFFPKETAWRVPFRTEPCHTEPFGSVIRTMARVEPAPADEVVLTARTAGIAVLGPDAPAEGASVRAGEVLLYIAGSEMADGNLAVRLREAESNYRLARQEYERKQTLATDRIVAAADVEQARARLEAAEATYDALRRGFSGGKQAVAAPVAGTVTQLSVRNGQYVEAGQAVATVAQYRTLRLHAEVPTRYHRRLARLATAHLRLPDSGETYPLEALGGRIVSCGRTATAARPLLPVVLEVTPPAEVMPPAGTFVEVYLKTQGETPAITVPMGAIVEEMGTHFVFVQRTPERFEKRPVRLGDTDGLRTEVAEGLTPGERIVSEGAVLVKLAQAAGTLDVHSGHSH